MSFLVAQLGARMHYAIPRMLQAQGRLERFYTDLCTARGWPRCLRLIPEKLRPAEVKRLLGRTPPGVPPERICAFTAFGCQYARRRRRAGSSAEATAVHLWAGKTFCERVISRGFGGASSVYTFNSAGLELLRNARRRGLRTVMEQTIAPKKIELELLRAEQAAFPEWQTPRPDEGAAAAFIAREEAEWRECDLILCGSDFVRDGIARCGGPAERCVVVPYGVDTTFEVPASRAHEGPLRVLTIGEVGLRKGSPYVLAAAKRFQGQAHFRMIGSINVRPEALRQLQQHVEVLGPVPRSTVREHYAWADVFLLPSLCEGSATVTYEALACGVPVIATPNTGSIVREGVDGFIVPIRDPEAIAAKLELFISQPDLLETMSRNCHEGAREGSLAGYARRLNQALERLPTSSNPL
jgi:hypothetical protein